MHFRPRSLMLVLLGLLLAFPTPAFAAGNGSSPVANLDPRFEGWFSNGMTNDPEACGPFEASEDAVVWHLFVDLPQEAELEHEEVKVVLGFGGSQVRSVTEHQIGPERIDIWAKVELKTRNPSHVRKGAHTSIRSGKAILGPGVGGVGSIQLGNVCYEGLGPIGEMTINLQGLVCDGYDRLPGNQVNEESAKWDATGGMWEAWGKAYQSDRPTVKVVGRSKGCSFAEGQRFAVGTSPGMDDYHTVPGATDPSNKGLIQLSTSQLPEEHRKSLFWATEELWFQRLDNDFQPGVFHCYEDSLHPDNFEWILIRDYDRLPESITCVAWNVNPTRGVR